MADSEDPLRISFILKYWKCFLGVLGFFGIGSSVFPIYAFIKEKDLLVPSAVFAVIFVFSIILMLIIYYEAKIQQIRDNPISILKIRFAKGEIIDEKEFLSSVKVLGKIKKDEQKK